MKESGDLYRDHAFVRTQAGRFVMARPTWPINAIAHSLGQQARYNGHANEQYSVAEHSVLVSLLMEYVTGGDPMEGLMHDGTEYVMTDIAAPWKQFFPDWRAKDAELELDLRRTYSLPLHKTVECKSADWIALFIEAAQIVPGGGADFQDPEGFRPKALELRRHGWRISCLPWRSARDLFLDRYRMLEYKRGALSGAAKV